jgi:hypothetical protein
MPGGQASPGSLRDADYARRIDDAGFEAVATAIADATAR